MASVQLSRYDTYTVLKRNTKMFCLIIWVDKADTKKWLPNGATKHRRFCPKTTKFYFFVIVMVSLEYALFIFVLQLPRCRSRDTFRKFLDKRVHASTILCSRTSPSSHFLIAISHMSYIGGNDKHTFEQGLLPQFTITKLFTHNHASNNILQYQTPLLAALWFDSENLEFIMWQNRNSWNFSHQFILAWFLECDTFCMALQGFSVLIS